MKHLDLFSGYGGFSLALEPYCETIGFSEIDKYANQLLAHKFPNIKNYGDISAINTGDLPDFDILTFGWPCQDISIAGNRKGLGGARSGLLNEAVRILRDKKPRYFIAENVKGLFSVNEGADFYEAIRLLSDAGYDMQWQLCNTSWVLPQNRERIFFIGHARGTSRPEVFPITEDDCEPYRKRGRFQRKISAEDTANCLTSRYYKMGVTDNYVLKQINDAESQGYRVYDSEGIATCIASGAVGMGAKTGLYSMSNAQVRRLTPRECERLQGLEDDWTRYGTEGEISDTQRYKLIGNGISVPVVRLIADKLFTKR